MKEAEEDEGGIGICNVHGILENGGAVDILSPHLLLEALSSTQFQFQFSSSQFIAFDFPLGI